MTTQLRVINYWMRSKLGTAPVLVKEAVRLSEAMSASRFDSWFTKVKTIITKLGFAYVMDQPETLVNSEIGQRLYDTFLQQWTSNLWDDFGRGNGSRNKLRTYKMFKQDFYLESYLLQIKDSAMRRSLCCFRISYHPLQFVRGRYHRPRPIPAGQRYCPLCHKRGSDMQ